MTLISEVARARGGHFNIIHADSALKADFYPANRDELQGWAFRHARSYSLGEMKIALAPPEYTIIKKLAFYREGGSQKHLRDIRSMLAVSGDQIDCGEISEWVRGLGLVKEWGEVQKP